MTAVPPDTAGSTIVFAGTPVSAVDVSIDGLHSRTRAAVLAAAAPVRRAATLGDLDTALRRAAADLAPIAASYGDSVAIEVSPGKERGCIHVAFRPPLGWRGVVDLGLDRLELEPSGVARLECRTHADDVGGRPPLSLSLEPRVGTGGSFAGTLRMSPILPPGAQPLAEVEITSRVAGTKGLFGLLGLLGLGQCTTLGALSLSDPSRKHNLRFEASKGDVVTDSGTSNAALDLPLQTSKTSVGYRFLRDEQHEGGDLRSASVELAGLAGDVAHVRAEGLWARSVPFHAGFWRLAASGGLVSPLGGKVPLEDRFFLGGATGGPAGRLPGFSSSSIGPCDSRRDNQGFDYLGGNARWSASAVLSWPLPSAPIAGLRPHVLVFGAAGALVDKAGPTLLQDLIGQTRASVGAGLGTPLPGDGFLGVSLAQPLLARSTDGQQRLQFWFSLGSLL
eukprot:gnl/TRDRNA2_/TRDRNA2_138308_c1_seq1.p1 gnl/TRDRNA2_/TRDRNA2_138308_c1~~gnl/TRDRNA2_/TRDRNA2_138308_c1_seq1.p1  ORF type:complete len:449 (+),score=63.65 gnl/TRDRNA2_/TRDRNA2_138308_c1_seq1:92-1438(+)